MASGVVERGQADVSNAEWFLPKWTKCCSSNSSSSSSIDSACSDVSADGFHSVDRSNDVSISSNISCRPNCGSCSGSNRSLSSSMGTTPMFLWSTPCSTTRRQSQKPPRFLFSFYWNLCLIPALFLLPRSSADSRVRQSILDQWGASLSSLIGNQAIIPLRHPLSELAGSPFMAKKSGLGSLMSLEYAEALRMQTLARGRHFFASSRDQARTGSSNETLTVHGAQEFRASELEGRSVRRRKLREVKTSEYSSSSSSNSSSSSRSSSSSSSSNNSSSSNSSSSSSDIKLQLPPGMASGTPGAYLQLQGNVDPQVMGLYYTEIQLGSPVKSYKVQVDTGSNLVWLNCQPCLSCATSPGNSPYDPSASSSSSPLPCDTSTCASFQAQESQLPRGCLASSPNDKRCYYWLIYGDGSSTTGYMVQEQMHYRQLDGSTASMPLMFGCGYNQTGNLIAPPQEVDGLLGLGVGRVSLTTQMQKQGHSSAAFALCLGSSKFGGGTLILGPAFAEGTLFTPLYTPNTHYAVKLKGLSLGSQPLSAIDSSSFPEFSGGGGNAIVDSGTTLAIFPEPVYNDLINALTSSTTLKPATTVSDFFCFGFGSSTIDDLPDFFPTLTLHFEGNDMVLPPSKYIFVKYDSQGKFACVGFVPGSQAILGDIVLQDFLVSFDVDQGRLGWASFDCAQSEQTALTASNSTSNLGIFLGYSNINEGPSTFVTLRCIRILLLLAVLALLMP